MTQYASRKRGGRFGTNGVLRPAKGGEATAAAIVTAAPTTFSADQAVVFDALVEWTKNPTPLMSFAGLAGTGKGQPLDALVMTPFGARRMGDLDVGGMVSNPDGTIARILQVHELGERDTFRVSFMDGASTVVTGDHLWLVKRASKKLKAERLDMNGQKLWGRIETTEQLITYMATQKGRTRTYMPQVPLTAPVKFTVRTAHTLDSYVLGALLGDGGMTQNTLMFTTADAAILHEMEWRLGQKLQNSNGNIGYRIPVSTGARTALQELGLWGHYSHEKFIPETYKYGNIASRFDLVRGLMDTDGTVSKGLASFTTTSFQLAVDLQWVLRSLGYRATITNKEPFYRDSQGSKVECRTAHTLHIQGRNLGDLFLLPRKQKICASKFNGGASPVARRIVSIVPEGKTVCRCITVDHPNGLYVTDDFIVTHNSTLAGALGLHLKQEALDVAYCAYTGKASQVLRGKLRASGVRPSYCGTIHRLIYQPVKDDFGDVEWQLRPDLPYDFIVLDEASMVGRELYDDLASYGIPILAVGDHGQLPPVGSDSFSLVENPDLKLEKIHRQAADNPILALSQHVRERGFLRGFKPTDDRVRIVPSTRPWLRECFSAPDCFDIAALSYTNQTRVDSNNLIRTVRGHGEQPRVGDIVICLKNTYFDSNGMIANGSRGLILSIKDDEAPSKLLKIAFLDDENIFEGKVNMGQFGRKDLFTFETLREAYPDNKFRNLEAAGLLCDFGYAMTTHKFQGSQANTVIVDGSMPSQVEDDTRRRWLYTSVTRSSENLIISGVG